MCCPIASFKEAHQYFDRRSCIGLSPIANEHRGQDERRTIPQQKSGHFGSVAGMSVSGGQGRLCIERNNASAEKWTTAYHRGTNAAAAAQAAGGAPPAGFPRRTPDWSEQKVRRPDRPAAFGCAPVSKVTFGAATVPSAAGADDVMV